MELIDDDIIGIIFDNMYDAVIVISKEGKILYTNTSARELYCYNKSEFIKLYINDIVCNSDIKNINKYLIENLGRIIEVEILGRKKDKNEFLSKARVISTRLVLDNEEILIYNIQKKYIENFDTEKKFLDSEINEIKNVAIQAIEGSELGIWNYDLKNNKISIHNNFFFKDKKLRNAGCFNLNNFEKKDIEEIKKNIFSLNRKKTKFEYIFKMKTDKESDVIWGRTKGQIVEFDNSDNPKLVAGILEDITNKKLHEENLINENISKSIFITNMSHEIRTPLNGIIVASEIIKKDLLNDEQSKYFSIIENSARTLNGIVTNILDFSKSECEKIDIKCEKIDILNVINNIIIEIQTAATKKRLETIFYIDPDIQNLYYGDIQKIKQILNNLISNSIKFTKNGRIGFRAEVVESDTMYDFITFEVKDTGVGINKKDQEKIFEAFYQCEEAVSKEYEGTGLGLTISKKYAEAMGGTIFFSSEINSGSTFVFKCKFKKSNNSIAVNNDLKIINKNKIESEENQIKILCVDDNIINQKLIKAVLEEQDYYVYQTYTAEETIRILNEIIPDLILLDIQLPQKSGYEVVNEIKIEKNFTKIPIIAMTAYARETDRLKCLKYGMDDFITKPIKVDHLLEKIKNILK